MGVLQINPAGSSETSSEGNNDIKSNEIRVSNKPDEVHPAIASLLPAGHHWRGVADPQRSARDTDGCD
jgi:hypothetical protein